LLYFALLIGIILIVFTSKLTQVFNKSSIWLLIVQIGVSLLIVMYGNLEVGFFNTIFGHQIELGYLAIPFSILFLVGFTNVMNIKKEQNPSMLLLPCITLVCISIFAYIIGDSSVSIIGISSILFTMSILIYGKLSGKVFIGRTITLILGFIIAVLSLSLIKVSIVTIYIPIFTLALPLALYNLFQHKSTSVQSIKISLLTAILFGALIFLVSSQVLWYLTFGLTIILVLTQLSPKYRFI
jgi:UDP-GlcNAc:undecaprenyl-phosphate/decaprenyl-phosphate GlcNAc-1-phosphate transferase